MGYLNYQRWDYMGNATGPSPPPGYQTGYEPPPAVSWWELVPGEDGLFVSTVSLFGWPTMTVMVRDASAVGAVFWRAATLDSLWAWGVHVCLVLCDYGLSHYESRTLLSVSEVCYRFRETSMYSTEPPQFGHSAGCSAVGSSRVWPQAAHSNVAPSGSYGFSLVICVLVNSTHLYSVSPSPSK